MCIRDSFQPRRLGAQRGCQWCQAGLQARQRPVQIDRRRACRGQRRNGGQQGVVVGPRYERQRHAVGGRYADQWRTSYLHAADRVPHVFQAGQSPHAVLVRQGGLVDDVHGTWIG